MIADTCTNGGVAGIKDIEAREVAEAGRERASSAELKTGRKAESFGIQAHLKISHQLAPKVTSRGAVFGSLELLKG